MQFNPGGGQGIVDDIDFIVGSNATNYPIAQKTRNVNRWMDRAASLIFTADGTWQWDDTNFTNLPIGTTNLVANQQDYAFDTTHLRITRVEILTEDDKNIRLRPFDQHQLEGQALTDFHKDAGTPQFYDKIAQSIFLYPKTSYAKDGGLKVYFQRGPSAFVVADTVKAPGFATIFHRYPSLGAAFDYAMARGLKNASQIRAELLEMERSMVEFYSKRQKDTRTRLVPHRVRAR